MILNIGYGISIGRLILSVIFILDGNNDGTSGLSRVRMFLIN